MSLRQLLDWVGDKARFTRIDDFSDFSAAYLDFIQNGLQAVIVSRNENKYNFFQYKGDGQFNVSRPINSDLMFSANDFDEKRRAFNDALSNIREIRQNSELRQVVNNFVYTCQQSIGAALDALPAGASNKARKMNGDLFEHYVRLILLKIGVDVTCGTVKVPVLVEGNEVFKMSYQHDVIVGNLEEVHAIGSVKTSSKDRIDKIFIDKFLYNKLTGRSTPHFAVFLNDVQRKGCESRYGINTTFLAGHFKGYSVQLNCLDGVYYCDARPNMSDDEFLKSQIRSFDHLLVEDIWRFLS